MFVALRLVLVVAAMAGAFVGGYVLRPTPVQRTAAAEPATNSTQPKMATAGTYVQKMTTAPRPVARATMTVSRTQSPPARAVAIEPPTVPHSADDKRTLLLPPQAANDKPEPVDPLDPAFQMIKRELGIKTTIRDKNEPPPAVLRAAQAEEPVMPPPAPMTGPPPRLDALPKVDIGMPVIADIPVARRLLNSREVELDFEVTRVGLSPVRAVELWTTRNRGNSWVKSDQMNGSKPPFRTRLGSEGEYGFRLVFESESGQRTPEPKSGQAAELGLELDTTPPSVELLHPRPVEREPGKVRLAWRTTDLHLDPNFLRLEYSADGNVWHAIERPTKGVFPSAHDWTLPAGVPAKVLIRVTARDLAGNIGTAESTDKVWIDLVAPEGKLTGVRVPGSAPEKGPMPRVVPERAAGERPAPAILRAMLEAFLNSPAWLPVAGASGVSAARHGLTDSPGRSGRDWVRELAATPAFRVPSNPAEEAANVEAQWREIGGGYRNVRPWVSVRYLGCSDCECEQFDDRRPILAEHRKLASESAGFVGGRSLAGLLGDVDWKPSIASAESYRPWDVSVAPNRPFDGVYDVVPHFWSSSDTGIRLDF
jgi:hypothetical protein